MNSILCDRAVIEQLVGALERVSAVDDDCDILSPSLTDALGAALTAGRAALETQGDEQSCSNCKNNAWPFGSCDGCGVQNDDRASGSNWEGVEQSPDCDICGSDCPLHPQATEPAWRPI